MKKGIVIGLLVGILILFFLNNSSESSWFITCPFKMMTGYDCPGCGSQRALCHLLHLHFMQAFLLNPLLFLVAIYTSIGLILNLKFFKNRFPQFKVNMFGTKVLMMALILILVFFILRNTEAYLTWISDMRLKD